MAAPVLTSFRQPCTCELDAKAGGINLMGIVANVSQLNLHTCSWEASHGGARTHWPHLSLHPAHGGTQEALCKTTDHEITSWFIAKGLQTVVPGDSRSILKPELGCLKDFELELKFKHEARPIFCKPRPVILAILEDLNDTYKEGIRKECGSPLPFQCLWNPRGSSVKGKPSRTKKKARIRVCGDYRIYLIERRDFY